MIDDEHLPWLYTIGLLDGFDHPEFVIAGACVERSGPILKAMAESVLKGERWRAGDALQVVEYSVEIGAVHEIQYDLDTFASWHELHDAGVLRSSSLVALQIVLGPTFFSGPFGSAQPLLSDHRARVGGPRPPGRS